MAPNLPSATSRPDVISAYLGKECASGNTAGPFPEPPLRDLIISPLGAVPKKRTGKWRLIMHLSYPEGSSINDGINVEDFPLKYMTVYDAMDSIMRLGQGALLAKLDIKSAFRLCPVHPADQHLLGMHWNGQYYFDRVLPFGLRSAPFIFNSLAEAVEWISKEGGVQVVHHYLDDFLILGKTKLTRVPDRLTKTYWALHAFRHSSSRRQARRPIYCIDISRNRVRFYSPPSPPPRGQTDGP
jgi:hypothetical protein